MRLAYVRVKIYIYILNESQQKPKPRRQHSTHKKKDRMKTNDVQIEIMPTPSSNDRTITRSMQRNELYGTRYTFRIITKQKHCRPPAPQDKTTGQPDISYDSYSRSVQVRLSASQCSERCLATWLIRGFSLRSRGEH